MGGYSRLKAQGMGLGLVMLCSCLPGVQAQGLPRDSASVLSSTAAALTLASALQRAEQWRQQAKLRPSGACNTGGSSLCAPRTSAADDSALMLATSPEAFDLRDPKQTGGLKVVTPVLDQGECNTCTAFAVAAAAETALAVGLRKPASAWFSPQDFFFCSSLAQGTERTCRSSWLIEPALAALVATTPTTPGCLPYAPLATKPCSHKCRDINPDVPTGRFIYARLTSEVDMQQWIRLRGGVLASMQVYPDLFTFLKAQPQGVYKGPGAGAKAEESYGHAVVLVGYSNKDNYWVVRSSWGPKVGVDGYFKVAYGASGIADSSNTWGLRFAPLKSAPAYTPSQVAPASKQGCYNYKAATGDYFSKVADKFAVSLKQLVLDNLGSVKDPAAPLAGRTLLVCNAREVADVLPPTAQADALLRIKAAIDPNNLLTTWSAQETNRSGGYCAWQGITCDREGNVQRILLSTGAVSDDSRLGGVLPEADLLLALPKLMALSIQLQDLVGTLPDSYSKLTKLQVLNLNGNKLRGTLPASWAGMVSLQTLALGGFVDNKAQGNLLGGTLPKEWGTMAKLRQLAVLGNALVGSLPPEWGSLRLEQLLLNLNQLTGTIPKAWTPLVVGQLTEVNLNKNSLSGPLQPEWGSARSLRTLHIANNKFSGAIPSSWAKIPSLIDVDLSGNQLTGTLPARWESKALTSLLVLNNKLSGPLPSWPAPNLVEFWVGRYYSEVCAGNKLTGMIPPSLPKLMPRLKVLRLPCNSLAGNLPEELGTLSQLTELDVSNNPGISGTLPASIGKLTKLTLLDVSRTKMTGTVPESFGALQALKTLNLIFTQLSGCIPAALASSDVIANLPIWMAESRITGVCS